MRVQLCYTAKQERRRAAQMHLHHECRNDLRAQADMRNPHLGRLQCTHLLGSKGRSNRVLGLAFEDPTYVSIQQAGLACDSDRRGSTGEYARACS